MLKQAREKDTAAGYDPDALEKLRPIARSAIRRQRVISTSTASGRAPNAMSPRRSRRSFIALGIPAMVQDILKETERLLTPMATIGTSIGVWSDRILGADTRMRKFSDVVAELAVALFDAFGDAVTNAFAAIVTGSESAGAAFKKAMLSAIAAVAKSEGMRALAKAGEAVAQAFLNPTIAGASLAAAARYAAAATAYFAVAGVAQGGSQGGGGGAGGSIRERHRTG